LDRPSFIPFSCTSRLPLETTLMVASVLSEMVANRLRTKVPQGHHQHDFPRLGAFDSRPGDRLVAEHDDREEIRGRSENVRKILEES
jgi:hypothetical protein